MNPFSLMAALSATVVLPCRAFGPLLIVCTLGAFPGLIDWIPGSNAPAFPEHLGWLTSVPALATIAVLAVLEAAASLLDDPDIKRLFNKVMEVVKTGVAVLVVLGVMPHEAVSQLTQLQAGWTSTAVVAALVAGGTFFLANLRSWVWSLWIEFDEENDFGLHLPFALAEEGWALVAILVVVAFPVLAFAFALLLLAFALLLRAALRWWSDRNRAPCPHCGEQVQASAVRCSFCQGARAPTELRDFGLLKGRRAWQGEVPDELLATHHMRLLSQGRCPACAERQDARTLLDEGCPACAASLSATLGPAWFEAYRAQVVGRAWKLMIPVALCGLLPSVGVAVGLVVSKVMVVAPLRLFLGKGSRVGMRWFLRVIAFLVFLLGSLPLFSLICAPLLMFLYLKFYGAAARRAVNKLQTEPGLATT
jgi:hypothetical protein